MRGWTARWLLAGLLAVLLSAVGPAAFLPAAAGSDWSPVSTAYTFTATYNVPGTLSAVHVVGHEDGANPDRWRGGLGRKGSAVAFGLGVAANAGRFELTALGGSRYQTPAGLIYGPGSKHGHRLTHVLQHGFPDVTKKTHSVFTSGSGALRTVDEAWLMRGAPDPSDLGKYVVPMGRTVGTGGETSVTVIVRPGTSQIITAYPSP